MHFGGNTENELFIIINIRCSKQRVSLNTILFLNSVCKSQLCVVYKF